MPNQNVFDKRGLSVQASYGSTPPFSKVVSTHQMAFVTGSFRLSPYPPQRSYLQVVSAQRIRASPQKNIQMVRHSPKDTYKLNDPALLVLTCGRTLCDGLNNVPQWACKDTHNSGNRCKSKSFYSLGCSYRDHNNIGFGWNRFHSSVLLCIRRSLQCVPAVGERVRHRARTCSQHTRRCVRIYTLLRRWAQPLLGRGSGNSHGGRLGCHSGGILGCSACLACKQSFIRNELARLQSPRFESVVGSAVAAVLQNVPRKIHSKNRRHLPFSIPAGTRDTWCAPGNFYFEYPYHFQHLLRR